jgi:hypothetical protein
MGFPIWKLRQAKVCSILGGEALTTVEYFIAERTRQ